MYLLVLVSKDIPLSSFHWLIWAPKCKNKKQTTIRKKSYNGIAEFAQHCKADLTKENKDLQIIFSWPARN